MSSAPIDHTMLAAEATPQAAVITLDFPHANTAHQPVLVPHHTPRPGLLAQLPQLPAQVLQRTLAQRETAYLVFKRLIDILVSLAFLILGSPLFLVVGLAVKLTSPGPVLFRHKRLGKGGRLFWCYKFRTMVANAGELLNQDAKLRQQFETAYKLKDDPRITRVGAFLRRTSLDEIPQFWNVLLGEMTLIGPRPIVMPEVMKYGAHAEKLLEVVPGLSGFWQTCGRSDASYHARVAMDILYIENRCLWLDLKLIMRTVSAVCSRAGAR